MSDNILESNFNKYPPITDWGQVFLILQQANEAFLRGATLKDFVRQVLGDVEIQGSDFFDLPVAEDSNPVALPIPTTSNKFGFLADGTFTQPTGGTLEYSATQWGLTLFDGNKWVKKFTLDLPEVKGVDVIDPEGDEVPKEKAVANYVKPTIEKVDTITGSNKIIDPEKSVDMGWNGNISYNTSASTLTGLGQDLGNIPAIDIVRIPKLKFTQSEFPITQITVLLRRISYVGAIIQEVTVPFNAQLDEEKDILIPFNRFDNILNENIWGEVRTDGRITRYESLNTVSNPKYSTGTIGTRFSTNSGNISDGKGFYIQVGLTKDVIVPSDYFIGEIKSKLDKPVENLNPEGTAVPTEKAVADYVNPTKESVEAAITSEEAFSAIVSTGDAGYYSYETGTITGFGNLIGKAQNFTRLRLPKFKWSQGAFPITEARITLRENGYTGSILLENATIPITSLINKEADIIIEVPIVENPNNANIWAEVRTNGRLARANALSGTNARYTTSTNIGTKFSTSSSVVGDGIGYLIEVGNPVSLPKPTSQFMAAIEKGLPNNSPFYADVVLPSYLYGVTGIEKNIYFNNFIYTNVPFEVLEVDVTCAAGHQMENKLWILNTQAAGTYPLNIKVSYNNELLANVDTTLIVADGTKSGNISCLEIWDSTAGLDGRIQSPVFEVISGKYTTDSLKVTFKGTQGTAPTNHEARGGYKILDYTGPGRTFYKFIVTSVSSVPGVNSKFTNNGSTFIVSENNITGSDGYISCERISGTNPPLSSGILTKVEGSGDTAVTYTSYSLVDGNPFWNSSTGQVDFLNYLTTRGISLLANDWVHIHLGINDIFHASSDAEIELITNDRLAKLEILINSIRSAVSGIKIGIAVNIPPSISQDAFGVSYYNGQTLKRYMKNLRIWQKALIKKFDSSTNLVNNIFVFDLHVVIDRKHNFPKGTQNANSRNSADKIIVYDNAVHPANSGYQQAGDELWALLKCR